MAKKIQKTNNTIVSKEVKNMKSAEIKDGKLYVNGRVITDVITEDLISIAKVDGFKVVRGKKGSKNEGFVKIDEFTYQIVGKMPEEDKPKQVHEVKDRDIKIESGKVGDIGVKLIYHREKDGTKQFRIFLSQKVDGKLKRIRYMTEELKTNQKDEKFVKKMYDQIIAGKVKVQVA